MTSGPRSQNYTSALALARTPTPEKLGALVVKFLKPMGLRTLKYRSDIVEGIRDAARQWTPKMLADSEMLVNIANFLQRVREFSSDTIKTLGPFIRDHIMITMDRESSQGNYEEDGLIHALTTIYNDPIRSPSWKHLVFDFKQTHLRHAFIRACMKGSYSDVCGLRKIPHSAQPEIVETFSQNTKPEERRRFTFIQGIGLIVDDANAQEICLALHWDASVQGTKPISLLWENRITSENIAAFSNALNNSVRASDGPATLPLWAQAYRTEALKSLDAVAS